MSNYKELREELIELHRRFDSAATQRECLSIAGEIEDTYNLKANYDTILAALEIAERGQWVKCSDEMPSEGEYIQYCPEGISRHCWIIGEVVDEDDDGTLIVQGESEEFQITNGGRFRYIDSAPPLPPEEK